MGKIRFVYNVQLLAVLSMVLMISGCGSSSSDSNSVADTTAPSVPTYLTAVAATDTKVSLRWLASTDNVGVTAYAIYRNDAYLATTTTATTAYSDAACTANTPYTYKVSSRDAAGNTSALSTSATTTTIISGFSDSSAPTAPGSLSATAASSSQISLTWTAATDNIGVSGYNIYRASASMGSYTKVGTTPALSYTDTGLTSGKTYFYVVKAFDGVPSESLTASNEAYATTQ